MFLLPLLYGNHTFDGLGTPFQHLFCYFVVRYEKVTPEASQKSLLELFWETFGPHLEQIWPLFEDLVAVVFRTVFSVRFR